MVGYVAVLNFKIVFYIIYVIMNRIKIFEQYFCKAKKKKKKKNKPKTSHVAGANVGKRVCEGRKGAKEERRCGSGALGRRSLK